MSLNALPFQYLLRGNRVADLSGQMLAAAVEQRDRDLEDYIGGLATTAYVDSKTESAVQASYKWNTSTVMADPGAGFIRANAAPGSATQLAVSVYDTAGTARIALLELEAGDRIALYYSDNLSNYVRYDVSAAITNNANVWVTIPVTVNITGGTFAPANNRDITAIWSASSGAGGNVPTTRIISTTLPLTGGGDLSANRTFAVNDFTSSARGTVPASGGGTSNFLRADGTWVPPFTPGFQGCALNHTGQSIGAGSQVSMAWDTEISDTDNYHPANSAIVTIPANCGGNYGVTTRIQASAAVSAMSAASIVIDGTYFASYIPAGQQACSATVVMPLNVGQTIQVSVYNAHSSALFFTGSLQVTRV